MLLAVPVLLGTMLYHYLNYRYGGQGMGGNKAMAEWVGFGYTQPMTLVYAVPAFGMFAEMAATASKQRLAMRGVMFIGLGLLGVSAFGAVTQTQPVLSEGVFDATFSTFAEQAVPFAFVVLLPLLGAAVVLGTVGLALRRKPTLSAPLLFAVFGMLMVFVGMLATVLVSIGDIGLGDSRAPEAAAVYVLGGALLAMLAAVLYWGPKLWGTVVPTAPSAPLALLGVAGVVLASLPHIIAGWADGFVETASIIGAIGYVALALTVLGVCSLLFLSWRKGERAADDPWGGQTLEWLTPSPAPADNFSHVRTVTSPEPLFDLQPQLQGSAE
jgi:heme/copper-type cytochrome/quinol oxidase subunit 1